MNLSSIIGFLLAGIVVWECVIAESPNPAMLLDPKAFFLVAGGSIAAGLVIYPISSLVSLIKVLIFGVILKKTPNRANLVKQLVSAASLHPQEHNILPLCPSGHPLMTEGFKLISENRLTVTELTDVLERRSQHFKQSYMADAKMLATLAKFPSAFGMLGSTVGLIDMMTQLGSENGQAGIGNSMAMALVATFWGLVFTYMILMPLSDYAARLAIEDSLIRQMIVEGLILIKQGKEPQIILDKLNGFLSISNRITLIKKTNIAEANWDEINEEIEKFRKRA